MRPHTLSACCEVSVQCETGHNAPDATDSQETGQGVPIEGEINANSAVDELSSHSSQHLGARINPEQIRQASSDGFVEAISYLDADGDGDIDLFFAPRDGSDNLVQLYLNDGNNTYSLDGDFFDGNPPSGDRPLKSIVGDYNGDGKIDIFVVGSGQLIGEEPMLILSSDYGFTSGLGMEDFTGSHYVATSADIDGDGDLDIFLSGNDLPFFMINDGTGTFTKDSTRISGISGPYFVAELVDIDSDGFIDLVVGGHEYENAQTKVLWGSSTGHYDAANNSEIIPAVSEFGVVKDIDVADVNGDAIKEIIITRTGDGTGSVTAFTGYYIQIVEQPESRSFVDITSENITSGTSPALASFKSHIPLVRDS